ncbi:MAG TPA: radical SAM protein [Planctomycetota bacterium]|jgi:hypothetical protein|nr:radical SAM protein [Planctomycetota bacterium]
MTHAIHDFAAKLRTPAVAPTLERYVEWRRELQAARAEGREEPEAPEMAPVSINLDLTLACNYACTHCIDWEILNSGPRMEEENLRESLRLMAERGLKSVILIGGGEPTLYPGFSDFVRFAKQDLGLQIAVVSNGSRGDRLLEIAPHLEEGDWIRLSLDSGSNELFREMHQPNSAAVDLDEICSWIPKIRAANPAPRLGYSFVIVWQGASRDEEQLLENIHEIVPAAIRAQEAGFDYISYKPVLERLDDGAEVMNPSHTSDDTLAVVRRIREQIQEARDDVRDSFEIYESTNLRSLEEGTWQEFTHQPKTCHMQALRQVLTPTGVFNCPAHRGVDKALLAPTDGYAGAAKAKETGRGLGRILDGFDASVECKEVTCLYHDVNWWIEGLVDNDKATIEKADGQGDTFL